MRIYGHMKCEFGSNYDMNMSTSVSHPLVAVKESTLTSVGSWDVIEGQHPLQLAL
jgi:hypothetical protein